MKLTSKEGKEIPMKPKREMMLIFSDMGNGFNWNTKADGFSIFEQIGIIESLKQDLIRRNFVSEPQKKK